MKRLLIFFLATLSPLLLCAGETYDIMKGWTFWADHRPEKMSVDLPHDAMLSETRSAEAPSGGAGGYFHSGIYHYEKYLSVPADWLSKHVTISFEGVYRNATVYVNGTEAGGVTYGYIPFDVVLDGLLREGDNLIRVDADNSALPNSRWYTGAGIYRPVHLTVQEQIRLEDVRITTLSTFPARIKVETAHQGGKVLVEILDGDKVIAKASSDKAEISIPDARLWSAETPILYTARICLKKGRTVVETREIPFGIRCISWSPQGLFVNGENVLLKGGCIHSDNGILGAAEYEEAAFRRIARMKEFGYNAVRMSHNPCSEALLHACDQLGMYVMDELWDVWFYHKNTHDYASDFMEHYLDDVRSLVRRDYNHPSVLMYSIGNENSEPVLEGGMEVAQNIIDLLHNLDGTRAVTGGFNLMVMSRSASGNGIYASANEDGESQKDNSTASIPAKQRKRRPMSSQAYNQMVMQVGTGMSSEASIGTPQVDSVTTPILDAVDIAGYNYGKGRYAKEGTLHPNRILVGSETFCQEIPDNWEAVLKYPYLIGDFMWTAWDYLGEAGIGGWTWDSDEIGGFEKPYPWILGDTGAIDIAGNPNGEAFLAKATWEDAPGTPYICVRPVKGEAYGSTWRGTNSIPSWSWPGKEGETATVEVFTSAEKVGLFLNGKDLGTTETRLNTATFRIPYEPGVLEAVAYSGVAECGRSSLVSATGEPRISIRQEPKYSNADKVVYADILLTGNNGEVFADRDCLLEVTVTGGRLLGFGSAEQKPVQSFLGGKYKTWYGRAVAAVLVEDNNATITVSGERYAPVTATLHIAGPDFLEEGFANPPQEARPLVWWHWMNGNVSKDGIRKDLEWMHRVGIAGFHQFDAGLATPQVVPERAEYMHENWKEDFRYAISLADSLGMEVGIASAPGWSATGGPWVKKQDAMKKLVWRSVRVNGGPQSVRLPAPYTSPGPYQNMPQTGFTSSMTGGVKVDDVLYEDIAVIAVKLSDGDIPLQELGAELTISGGKCTMEQLTNGDMTDAVLLPSDRKTGYAYLQYGFPGIQQICAATVCGHGTSFIEYSLDGETFTEILQIDPSETAVTVSFPSVKARYFRLRVPNPAGRGTRISEFEIYPSARINHAQEKAGFSTVMGLRKYRTPQENLPSVLEVVDITDKEKDGFLEWNVPDGNWKIYRFGYSLTGHLNHPAPPEATGLEVDKFDKDAMQRYLCTYLEMYQEASGGFLGEEGIRYMLTDSYEAGAQNWTGAMDREFHDRRGYDLRKWLPVLAGEVIGSADESERFLHDWRETLGELFAENYDLMTDLAKRYGMAGRYSESHEGQRAYVVDGMDVKRTAAVPMSACWIPSPVGGPSNTASQMDIRESASVAHLYGQNKVAAESFTAVGVGNTAYSFCPENLKPTADLMLSAGLNRFVIHESAHQPSDDHVPGLGLMVTGQWFNRHETWAEEAGAWVDYLSRSSYMLQQGRHVADILVYYGEDTNITAEWDTALPNFIPAGFDYDFINPYALEHLISSKDGFLTSPSGASYKVLYLTENAETMSLPVLRKIAELAADGAVICGHKPVRPASLADDPAEWNRLVRQTWRRKNVHEGEMRSFLPEADCVLPEGLRYVHRHTEDAEIYWVNKPSDDFKRVNISFRLAGKIPTLWNPVSGKIEDVSWKREGDRTVVSLEMVPDDAVFVVFREKSDSRSHFIPNNKLLSETSLTAPWKVEFLSGRGTPESIEMKTLISFTDFEEENIRHYSGTARYTCSFISSGSFKKTLLDLGRIGQLARVRVNGIDLGTVWKEPFVVDVTPALREGDNTLVVDVTNLWPNRLIGDASSETPYTYTHTKFYGPDAPLLESGLLGPVKLVEYE